MLILDKQKAVEHMLALAHADPALNPEAGLDLLHGRTRQRIAVYERRASVEATAERRTERAAGVLRPAGGAPSL